jgi:PDZ domain-containing secreted protein
VWSKLTHPATDKTASMRSGPLRQRARWSEPAAAAVGLARGGWQIASRIEAHVGNPTQPGLPEQAVIVAIDGQTFSASKEWAAAVEALDAGPHAFTTDLGEQYTFDGVELPYVDVETVAVPTRNIDVVVGGWMASTPAGKWYRNLASGSSHGLMVALVAYTHASGEQIGRGLAVAGTGTINPRGEVGRIRGLVAKAAAARDTGADVLLFPADQQGELAGFDAKGMTLLPVETIDDAITSLRALHV